MIITEELIETAVRRCACDPGLAIASALIGSPVAWLRPADLDWLSSEGLTPEIEPIDPPPDVFTRLAGDVSGYVRWGVAQHPACPVDVLDRLAGDDDVDVRRVVAHHPSCPVEVLARLAGDEDWLVRRAANRPRCNTSR